MGDDTEDPVQELQRLFKNVGEADYDEFKRTFKGLAKDMKKLEQYFNNPNIDESVYRKDPTKMVDTIIVELAKMRTPLYKALNGEKNETNN